MADLAALAAAIEAGDRASAVRITTEAVAEGMDPRAVLDAMTGAMEVIGGKFACNEIYVPEMLISARAMKEATAVLEPVLVAAGIKPEHTAVIGTIKGDLHDIGKNLVGMMWKGANIAVVDLGTNVTPEAFVAAAREHGASLVGVSALLTTTMVGMKDVVAAVRAELPDVKVIVGGAPVTAEYAASIGADGYAPDAASAVEAAKTWVSGAPPTITLTFSRSAARIAATTSRMPTIVVVSSALIPTRWASWARAASTKRSGVTFVPRSITSMFAPFHIIPTRFFPMSWRSPLIVPRTAVCSGRIPASMRTGSRTAVASFIARAEISISGT
jgi:5-methyltetrahydrofolate--homocysteine methyltransferase